MPLIEQQSTGNISSVFNLEIEAQDQKCNLAKA